MNIYKCSDNYSEEFNQYTDAVSAKYGMSGQASDRETMYLASCGNRAAKKACADLFFYQKIDAEKYYTKAFNLYLEASDMKLSEGKLIYGGDGNPQAFAMLAYYLFNYKESGYLTNCETIDELEKISRKGRIKMSLELCVSSLNYADIPLAINLMGRLFDECFREDGLYDFLKEDLALIHMPGFISEETGFVDNICSVDDCKKASDFYYNLAAKGGYVYACNNLAALESDIIISICEERKSAGETDYDITREISEDLAAHIEKYINYLRIAAAKFEPYASNRLGLFYVCGEISSTKLKKKMNFRSYCDTSLAKEYFKNATVYPNKNSAWAYYNLMKYYPKDYTSDLDLMNEHMDCIRRLDPKVYELAMED